MSQLTPYHPDRAEFLPPREEFAQITDLATRLAGTEFVPAGLRGDRGAANPPAVLAAMLTGRELGLAPMESLRSIHMIEGRPTLSAEATMKLAQEAGHLLIVTETTRTSATVKYRNASWPDDEPAHEITFDLEDAKLAGLTEGKRGAMYRKYPRAMLRSRAITEAARAGGLLSGAALAYTSEEITDDDDLAGRETIVVESLSPDEDDDDLAAEVEDELEVRRALYQRAGRAARRAIELDEEAGSAAWASATAGLPDEAWRDAPLDVLEIRVADLERILAQLEDEHDGGDDEDGQGGASPDDDGDAPDGGPVAPDDARAAQTATESHEEDDGDELDGPDPDGTSEDAPAPEPPTSDEAEPLAETTAEADTWDESVVEDALEGSPDGDELAQLGRRDRLVAMYPELNVAQVGELLRKGETEVDLEAGGTILVALPRDEAGGVLAAYELIEELEAAHHDQPRKTVRSALESAGWTPRGRARLAAARTRATMDEDDEAATPGSDTPPSAQSATQSDEEASISELLDRFGDLIERDGLAQEVRERFRRRLGELIAESDDGVPDRDALASIVRHLERS